MFIRSVCVVCGSAGASLCSDCRRACTPAPCIDWVDALEVRALLRYDDASRPIVLALKNANDRALSAFVGPAMGMLLFDRPPDIVTWAPTSNARRRARGYDQAELLARSVARSLDRPVVKVLRRERGISQHGKSRNARLSGVGRPQFSVASRSGWVSGGAKFLVVDDVITTGSTLLSAAAALHAAGSADVMALVLAASVRTPTRTTESDPQASDVVSRR